MQGEIWYAFSPQQATIPHLLNAYLARWLCERVFIKTAVQQKQLKSIAHVDERRLSVVSKFQILSFPQARDSGQIVTAMDEVISIAHSYTVH